LDTSESRSEISEKFRNAVPEKDGEDELDGSTEKKLSITWRQKERNFLKVIKSLKAN